MTDDLALHRRRETIIDLFDLARFMAESNAIEGETDNPGDLEAARPDNPEDRAMA